MLLIYLSVSPQISTIHKRSTSISKWSQELLTSSYQKTTVIFVKWPAILLPTIKNKGMRYTLAPVIPTKRDTIPAPRKTPATKSNLNFARHYTDHIRKSTHNELQKGVSTQYNGLNEASKKNYLVALEDHYIAIKHFDKLGNTNSKILSLIALTKYYLNSGNLELASEVYNKELKEFLKGTLQTLTKNRLLMLYGEILSQEEKYQEALNAFKKVTVTDLKAAPQFVSLYYKNLSNCYLHLNKLDTALVFAEKSFKINTSTQTKDLLLKNHFLFTIYIAKEEYKTAEKYLENSLTLVKDSKTLQDANLYYEIYEIEKQKGNLKKALLHYEKYTQSKDATNAIRLIHKRSILNYNSLQEKKEIKGLNQINKDKEAFLKKDTKYIGIIILLIYGAILSIIIFIYLDRKAKKQKFKLALDAAENLSKKRHQYLENLSQEIKTPMTIIGGYLNLIKNTHLNAAQTNSYANKAIISSQHIIDSVTSVLLVSKPEISSLERIKTSHKMEKFVKDLVFSFEVNAAIKEQHLYYKSNIKSEVIIDFDYYNLKKIISNLISNALKYTDPRKSIFVSICIEKVGLVFSVKDEGIGIPEKELEHLFSHFHQFEYTAVSGGFGMGLSLVQKLVTAMNGSIEVKSKEGVGSLFKVYIPLQIDKHESILRLDKPTYKSIDLKQKTKQKTKIENHLPKALIIEPNIQMITYLKDLLDIRLDCTFSSNESQGLSIAKLQQFHLVIFNNKTPLVNGLTFKSALYQIERYTSTPIIIISETPRKTIAQNNSTLEIKDYLFKPFTNEEILTKIDDLLENSVYTESLRSIAEDSISFNGSYSELMKKINQIILDNLADFDFNVRSLSEQCGYSQQQLTLILKSKANLTPGKLILELRLLKAYEYIIHKKYATLNDVIFHVGLTSRSYFNKVFLKRFGIAAKDLRGK